MHSQRCVPQQIKLQEVQRNNFRERSERNTGGMGKRQRKEIHVRSPKSPRGALDQQEETKRNRIGHSNNE